MKMNTNDTRSRVGDPTRPALRNSATILFSDPFFFLPFTFVLRHLRCSGPLSRGRKTEKKNVAMTLYCCLWYRNARDSWPFGALSHLSSLSLLLIHIFFSVFSLSQSPLIV